MSAWRSPPLEIVARFVRTEPYESARSASRAAEVLGSDERAALERIRPAAVRRDYLGAQVLARMMLAELAGCDPTQLRFRTSPYGRPELVTSPGTPGFRFSISHADGVALCAIATGRTVGAKIESLRNFGAGALSVAAAGCCRQDWDAVSALPPAARAERLLSVCTCKDAIAQAKGFGVSRPVAQTDGDPLRWVVGSMRVPPYHVAAVAVLCAADDDIPIRFEEGECFGAVTTVPARSTPSR